MAVQTESTLRLLVKAYSGIRMNVGGFDLPIVLDLRGMAYGKSLVANLDHDYTKRVGNVSAHSTANGELMLTCDVTAATPHAEEVERSIGKGFKWQASVEAVPIKANQLRDGESANVNGRAVSGPCYVITQSLLKGFAFVSHGADDNTEVTLAQWQER